ncbi:hypothetical protein JW899_03940 [Candidatus Uhrbacteria bacterium]|nr:hypothetical protein [Candidatus Uhrbacteria bacterium]
MSDRLVTELEGVGLSDREAKIYLSSLKLGAATAQTIAARATVNRPTTYISIESLVKRGLMSSVVRGKKRYFVAEPPDKIFRMIQEQKRILEDREGRAARIMDDLKALAVGSGDRPEALTFEGQNGLERMGESLQKSTAKEICAFFPSFEGWNAAVFPEGKTVRAICADRGENSGLGVRKGSEMRAIPAGDYPFDGEIVICGSLVNITVRRPEPAGVQVSNEAMANTLRQMFRLAWKGADGGQE